ncbi:MAG: flagellar biosynthesis protein FlhB [Butyrivibrio sp.]|nr:flagellar biosynthesis protein FlhB [Butyrivibrio sp.]
MDCNLEMLRKPLIEYDLQFFAKDGPGGEKTEEPTSKKKQDARNDGNVANSNEVNNAASLMIFFVLIAVYHQNMADRILAIFRNVYNQIPEYIVMYDGYVPTKAMQTMVGQILINVLIISLPFMALALIVGLICNIVQVGWKITTKPLKPKFSKLNPIKGFKNMFSVKKIFELVKSLLKLVLLFGVIYSYVSGLDESIFLLYDISLGQSIETMGVILVNIGIRIAAWYVLIAAADVAYTRYKHHEDLKMTKQEVKDEYKNTEGDPQIKSKQKQRMMEASRRRMMQNLPQADVVITNPTHYAVAILYEADKYEAPRVIAKGEDYLAQKIKEVAKENDIEIVENKPLARMLYATVEVGEFVPPELYKAVAEVLAFVYHLKGKV